MSKNKKHHKKASKGYVTIENAEALHSDTFYVMQKIVEEAKATADNPEEGAACIDKDQLRLAVNFLRDNGIKPMSEFEREQLRLQEKALDDGFDSDKQRKKHLEEIRKQQQGKISLYVNKAESVPVPDSVRDNRLRDIAERMEAAEIEADKLEARESERKEEVRVKKLKGDRKQIKIEARELGLSVDDYLETLPVTVKLEALGVLVDWKEWKLMQEKK